MTVPTNGYIILDNETGEFDWDMVIHPTYDKAVSSLTSRWSGMSSVPDQVDEFGDPRTLWYDSYSIFKIEKVEHDA